MTEYQHSRSLTRLWVVGLLGVVYAAVFALRPAVLGSPLLAGSAGVLLGLYICSHPAANAIDLLFYGRVGRYVAYSRQSEIVWLIVNFAVLLVGLIVIIIGATRFSLPAR
jgi:hypothetical protein